MMRADAPEMPADAREVQADDVGRVFGQIASADEARR